MIKQERQIRGIPLWLLREYLEELGGTAQGENVVQGDGWKITLQKMEPFQLGSLRVGQVKMEIEGDETTWRELKPRLDQKTMRAGA